MGSTAHLSEKVQRKLIDKPFVDKLPKLIFGHQRCSISKLMSQRHVLLWCCFECWQHHHRLVLGHLAKLLITAAVQTALSAADKSCLQGVKTHSFAWACKVWSKCCAPVQCAEPSRQPGVVQLLNTHDTKTAAGCLLRSSSKAMMLVRLRNPASMLSCCEHGSASYHP